MDREIPNIEVIRSVWRRAKKPIQVRDLQPVIDVKGGGGRTANPNPSQEALAAQAPQAHGIMCLKKEILSDAQRTSSFRVRD